VLDAFSVFSMCDILRLMNIPCIHRVFESPKATINQKPFAKASCSERFYILFVINQLMREAVYPINVAMLPHSKAAECFF
jgi:hypothetical protein